MGYRLIGGLTRADVAFRAEEESLEELFRTAWRATLELMLPAARLESRERRHIEVANPAVDLLLFDFLGELIYYKDAEGLLLDLESLTLRGGTGGDRRPAPGTRAARAPRLSSARCSSHQSRSSWPGGRESSQVRRASATPATGSRPSLST